MKWPVQCRMADNTIGKWEDTRKIEKNYNKRLLIEGKSNKGPNYMTQFRPCRRQTDENSSFVVSTNFELLIPVVLSHTSNTTNGHPQALRYTSLASMYRNSWCRLRYKLYYHFRDFSSCCYPSYRQTYFCLVTSSFLVFFFYYFPIALTLEFILRTFFIWTLIRAVHLLSLNFTQSQIGFFFTFLTVFFVFDTTEPHSHWLCNLYVDCFVSIWDNDFGCIYFDCYVCSVAYEYLYFFKKINTKNWLLNTGKL